MINSTIKDQDIDIREDMYASVVLSGEGTMMKGLPERLAKELQALTNFEVKVYAAEDRNISTW
jgi:actin-related protein